MLNQHEGIPGALTGSERGALDVRQARRQPAAWIPIGLLLAQALAGCGGHGSSAGPAATSVTPTPTVPAPTPTVPPPIVAPPTVPPPIVAPPTVPPPIVAPPTANSIHGRYVGTVAIDGENYFGDALLTIDGSIRLYVGGRYSDTGALQLTKAEASAQFVGSMDVRSGLTTGTGVIIGQGCSVLVLPRFCAKPAPGEIAVSTDGDLMSGAIRVTTDRGVESWRLQLHAWYNFYELPARIEYVMGVYQEKLAEFAPDGDVIMSVDGAGRLFFQSATSDCTGNGVLAPHLDGTFNVYDITLTVEGCSGPYAYLNGAYEGLSTTSASAAWDYDTSLRSWLSKRAGDRSPPAALVLWGRPI